MRNTTLFRSAFSCAMLAALLPIASVAQSTPSKDARRVTTPQAQARIAKEVRHELTMIPQYGVFDNLAYKVEGDKVTLLGSVTLPVIKTNAENAVKSIEGVEKVDNQIQVLPVFSTDNDIRVAVYRAIYGNPALQRYALQAVPSIHIIVNNGNVTLEGVVLNKSDGDNATIRAKTVPGVFSVTNNLKTDEQNAQSADRVSKAK